MVDDKCFWPEKVSVGEVVYPPGGAFGPRLQRNLQLIMLHSGHMTVWIDGVPRATPADTVCVLFPGHEERFTFAEECESWHSWLHIFSPQLSETLLARLALTLDMIAIAAAVSPAHLIRLFRQQLNTTPMAYLWERRVTQGIELLRQTGLGVGEIANRCGFRTSYHFSRRVRQAAGLSPLEVRQQAWQCK